MKLCVNGKPACPARACAGRAFFRARSTDGCPSLAWTGARTASAARGASSWRMLSACDREADCCHHALVSELAGNPLHSSPVSIYFYVISTHHEVD